MRNSPPTVFDAARYRLTAAEYFRRAGEARDALAAKRLEAIAREFVALAQKADLALATGRVDEPALERRQ
jgi:hypothetical protein